MNAEKVVIDNVDELRNAIDRSGARNSDMMAVRGIYRNVLVTDVPGEKARILKRHYNDVGAEVAISYDACISSDDIHLERVTCSSIRA